ncbi:MAG: hypothetical protein ABSD96_06500 [Candidatus Korobacteraceae bacterium]|jgi:hypothetical protein
MNCFPFDFLQPRLRLLMAWLLLMLAAVPLAAETCQEAGEIDSATRSAIESTAKSFLGMSVGGDVAGMRAASMPSLAANFGGIEQAVLENKAGLAGPAVIRKTYLLDVTGTAPVERAEFFCGVFGANGNTANSAGFVLPNLAPGRYAVVIIDINGPKEPYILSEILQQLGGVWKLAGYYAKSGHVAGHDADWYAQKAREFKQKGQIHNAWFYFWEARDLASPVPFMSTLKLDRLYEEAERVRPSDMPTDGQVSIAMGTRAVKLLAAFPIVVNDQMALVVKYQSPDISNTAQTFEDNTALMKTLVVKYPELRDGFSAIVVRAVAPNGQDYGTLLAMKDIK